MIPVDFFVDDGQFFIINNLTALHIIHGIFFDHAGQSISPGLGWLNNCFFLSFGASKVLAGFSTAFLINKFFFSSHQLMYLIGNTLV
jgi:hypothetical protein